MSAFEIPTPRPRTASLQDWTQRFLRFQNAGLSVAAFCRTEGVSVPSFYYWKPRCANAPKTATLEATPLLPVHILPNPTPLELLLPNGSLLRVNPGCDLAFVRALVDALREESC